MQEFINSEKEKRFLRDNTPVVLDFNSDDEPASTIIERSETGSDEKISDSKLRESA